MLLAGLPMSPAEIPHDLGGVAAVALLLGMKHGFDADHLAAIDGLTRCNYATRPRLARLSGVLFSLGHGAVVVATAMIVATLAQAWRVPEWLESFGAWVSIVVLCLLAALNIDSALSTPSHHVARLVGWRSRRFSRLLTSGNPLAVAAIGALFAFSFDTLSQASLFAVAANPFGGWMTALLLASLFVVGMLLSDGLNGIWISRLIRRSDETARVASRVMAVAVSAVSLLTATFGASKLLLPQLDAWAEGKELWLGAFVMLVIFTSFLLGMRLARRQGAKPVDQPAATVTPN